MRKTKGNIINLSSLVAKIGQPGAVSYVASKVKNNPSILIDCQTMNNLEIVSQKRINNQHSSRSSCALHLFFFGGGGAGVGTSSTLGIQGGETDDWLGENDVAY